MLTDIEKEKIKLEESYRIEVKKLVETKEGKSWTSKVSGFLNSSFGLWLLSAIFISGGVKLYEDYKIDQQESQKLNEAISKLDIEIAYRYSRILVNLYELTDKDLDSASLSEKYNEEDVKRIALSLNSSKNSKGDFLYFEYANFSLLALLSEEKRVLGQLGESDDEINQVISHIAGLEVFYEVQKAKFTDIQAIAISIEKHLILSRWRDNRFYFLDGDENNPFP